jgi:hypothetical protein
VRLRVRALEVERMLDRVELRQKMLVTGLSAAACLHAAQTAARSGAAFVLGLPGLGALTGSAASRARAAAAAVALARLCSVLAFALASRLGWATWSAVSALRALEAQQLRFSNMRDDI